MFGLSPESFLPSLHVLDAEPSLHCASTPQNHVSKVRGLRAEHPAFSSLAWQPMHHIQAYAGEVSDHHSKYTWCVVGPRHNLRHPPGVEGSTTLGNVKEKRWWPVSMVQILPCIWVVGCYECSDMISIEVMQCEVIGWIQIYKTHLVSLCVRNNLTCLKFLLHQLSNRFHHNQSLSVQNHAGE